MNMPSSEQRKDRREKGLCTRCGGEREDDRFLMCEDCRRISRESKKKDYMMYGSRKTKERVEIDKRRRKELIEYRKENNLCIYCGGQNDEEGYMSCSKCRSKKREQRKQSKEYKEKIGVCNLCGIYPVCGDEKWCPECRAKRASYSKEYRSKNKEKVRLKENELRRKREARYKKIGLCSCGRNKTPGYETCWRCRSKNAIRSRTLHQKKTGVSMEDLLYRPEKGLCFYCGNPVKTGLNVKSEPYRVCEECYERGKKNLELANKSKKGSYWKQDNNIIFNGR